jgi:hypothetical protein
MFGKKGPEADHLAVVLLADPRDGSYEPFYMAQCDKCGWISDQFSDESSAFEEARAHAEHVDPEVRDTLDPNYKPH